MIHLTQETGLLEGISNIKNTFVSLKDGTIESIEVIGKLSKVILNAIDWIVTVITHPSIILTFIDKMSLVIIMILLVLKLLGFENLEKWIWLGIILKVVAMVFL